jgi:hypothetical protein
MSKPWSAEEIAIATSMRTAKPPKSCREIGEAIGRSADNVARFFNRINGTDSKKDEETIKVMRGLGQNRWEPSPEQWADLARREAAPHTESTLVLGDPTTRRWDSNADRKVRAEIDDDLILAGLRRLRKARKGNFAVVRKYKELRARAMQEAQESQNHGSFG